jgi:hypothetical protein
MEDTLEELREALRDLKAPEVTNTGAVGGSYGYESILSSNVADTITLSGYPYPNNNTVIGGGYTVATGLGINYPNTLASGTYTVNSTGINWANGAGNITANPWATTTAAGRMELNGDNADLVINGVSILDILQDRLNVMIPNPALEKEWDELKALGDQYRALEAKLKEQGDMWAKLKSMPPPDIV